jgi:DNA-directed RNA polymerase specialized sigma24 family protein
LNTVETMPTLSDVQAQRVQLNDPALASLIEASDEAARERALENILSSRAHQLIRRIVSRARGPMLRDEDVEDIAATIDLRLVRRLQRVVLFEDDAIASLADFVATLSFHTIYDFLRRRYPERTRLKNRMRYILTHNPKLAMWSTPSGVAAGLREWNGNAPRRTAELTKKNASPAMLAADRPSEALEAILRALGAPILVDDLVDTVAALWGIVDRIPERQDAATDRTPAPDARLESRQYFRILWEEIRALRAPQRGALLLHIRDAEGMSALALLVLLGIATFDDVASVLEISADRLGALWPDLPLDDLSIAAALGVSRQQVINFRKAARARLARRMARAEADRGGRARG